MKRHEEARSCMDASPPHGYVACTLMLVWMLCAGHGCASDGEIRHFVQRYRLYDTAPPPVTEINEGRVAWEGIVDGSLREYTIDRELRLVMLFPEDTSHDIANQPFEIVMQIDGSWVVGQDQASGNLDILTAKLAPRIGSSPTQGPNTLVPILRVLDSGTGVTPWSVSPSSSIVKDPAATVNGEVAAIWVMPMSIYVVDTRLPHLRRYTIFLYLEITATGECRVSLRDTIEGFEGEGWRMTEDNGRTIFSTPAKSRSDRTRSMVKEK